MSEEKKKWLLSPAAQELRNKYSKLATVQANNVMDLAMKSSDPEVRASALSYATWKAAIKELEVINDDE